MLSKFSADESLILREYTSRWSFIARKNQLPPSGDWFCWLIRTGRGWGKTRTGAEWILSRVAQGYKRIALIGQTKADVRDTMVELGDSSILKVAPPHLRPEYEPSKRRLSWKNGAVAIFYSGDEPDQLRGPQHDTVWIDELAKFQYPEETWDNMEMGLRLGNKPQILVTTTPRPIAIIRRLVKDQRTIDITGSTFENEANLSPDFITRIRQRYEGTRTGRQELYGELLDDVEGALWNYKLLDTCRDAQNVEFKRVVVAIDPAVTSEEGSDETGIIVAGIDNAGKAYVIDDLSVKASPNEWARRAIAAYHKYKADRIVAEVNQGGDMVESIIRHIDPAISYRAVHAAKGKYTRAEPVAALYEQGRVKHRGSFPVLEDQLCNWVQGESSPDRLDALVWAVTDLCLSSNTPQTGVITINRKW